MLKAFIITTFIVISNSLTCDPVPGTPINDPIGTPRGLNPGRVTWFYPPNLFEVPATWDGDDRHFWWKNIYTDQTLIDKAFSDSIRTLAADKTTETPTKKEAWEKIFKFFNKEHGGIDATYTPGEKIAIKINLNTNQAKDTDTNGNGVSPQVLKALIRQLVGVVGADPKDITVYDASRYMNPCYIRGGEGLKWEFPTLNLVDHFGGEDTTKVVVDQASNLIFSSTKIVDNTHTLLPTVITAAKYVISLGALRGHIYAGFTATGKNWFGSIYRHVEGQECDIFGYWCPMTLHATIKVRDNPMGSYNPLVDLLGHKDLGDKCLLYMIDGMYGGLKQDPEDIPLKWEMTPFNYYWSNSLFISQDPVALDSVIFDFIRNEPTLATMIYEFNEEMVKGEIFCVDNYLHEAALANNPPSKTVYAPDERGQLKSLGVHEHWNNVNDKQYSKNLGSGEGIELIKVESIVADCDPEPGTPINQPIGVARGANPGRVTWAYQIWPNPSTWDGETDHFWWREYYTDQAVVDFMFRDTIRSLAGDAKTTKEAAWDILFKHFNKEHGEEAAYAPGEKITIKMNLNTNQEYTNTNGNGVSPQLIKALIRQLVYVVGVDQKDITIFDASRYMNKCYIDPPEGLSIEFPNLNLVDGFGGHDTTKVVPDNTTENNLIFSNSDVLGYEKTALPTVVTEAKYMITLSAFRGHILAGITATAKNFFGSIYRDVDPFPNVHKCGPFGSWCPETLHDFVGVANREMGTYTPLVDLLGHKDLGDKCLIYMVDGLYGGLKQDPIDLPLLWEMLPFNKTSWTGSIFVSQDPVALDSVVFDFIRSEPKLKTMIYRGDNADGKPFCVDNYLHEAALANDPPSGTEYHPDSRGKIAKSLGVHEHWNNAIDKQYSKNLGTGPGIELLLVQELGAICNPVPGADPNQPIGSAQGIHPGRVVWSHNPGATSWDGQSSSFWWENSNTDAGVASDMMQNSLQELTGESDIGDAWRSLFEYFKQKRGGNKSEGYEVGEKVAIKLNLNTNQDGRNTNANGVSPQMAKALVRQLIDNAGVREEDITLYDASRYINPMYLDSPQGLSEEFPDLNLVDYYGGERTVAVEYDTNAKLRFSNTDVLLNNITYLPTVVSEATYMISLGAFRGHVLAGITATGKNWFGSIYRPTPNHFNIFGYWCPESVHDFVNARDMEMGTYNDLVDLLGHDDLGGKCLLFIIDGLYGGLKQDPTDLPLLWKMKPFNNHYSSSLFISQDPIALDSVIFDFIRNEKTIETMIYRNIGTKEEYKKGDIYCIDNYLHEAALANDPPSKTLYDPNFKGRLGSLGVHEHWNSVDKKEYSRNLDSEGKGIELIKIGSGSGSGGSGGMKGWAIALIVVAGCLGGIIVGGYFCYKKRGRKRRDEGLLLTYEAQGKNINDSTKLD